MSTGFFFKGPLLFGVIVTQAGSSFSALVIAFPLLSVSLRALASLSDGGTYVELTSFSIGPMCGYSLRTAIGRVTVGGGMFLVHFFVFVTIGLVLWTVLGKNLQA